MDSKDSTKCFSHLLVINPEIACRDNGMQELFVVICVGPVNNLLAFGHRDCWDRD